MNAISKIGKLLFVFLFISLLLWSALSSSTVFAQAGVSISPALIEETLDPGFVKEYSISIRNLESREQTYYLSTKNISDVLAGGVPVFADENTTPTGMELADWIQLGESSITLQPNEARDIPFVMNVPDTASPGSHFGGIFISVDAPEIQQSGAAVGFEVANIISIRVSGDVNEFASIRQFSTDKFLYGSQNVNFEIRVENSGNVLVRPTGPLEIYNMLGKKVDTITFNEEGSAIPPKFPNPVDPSQNGVRDFRLSWQGEGIGFGRYEAIVSAVYGNEGAIQTMSSTASFWVLPMNIIGPALGILAVILLVVFVVARIYINRTLARLSGGTSSRMVRRRRRQGPSPVLLLTVVMLVVISLFLIVLLVLFA